MPQQTRSKLIPLVIMTVVILVVAGLIFRDHFAFSKEGKIVSRASIIDTDGDGLTDQEEAKYKTNPHQADSDGDGISDLEEIQKGTDPNKAEVIPDADGDGLTLEEEQRYGTDPNKADTDGDGYLDGEEIVSGHDPLVPSKTPKVAGVSDEISKSLEGLTQGLTPAEILKNIDTSPVELPDIPDSELNITNESGKEAVRKYFDEVERVFNDQLPFLVGQEKLRSYLPKFSLIIRDKKESDKLADNIQSALKELKKISTPKECKDLKKITIGMLEVAPDLLKNINSSIENGDIQKYTSLMYKIQSLINKGDEIGSYIIRLRKKYDFK